MRRISWLALALALAACGNPAAAPDAGGGDAGGADSGLPRCARDLDCANGLWCDGEERCAPDDPRADAMGCVAVTARCDSAGCDEANDRCLGSCVDADGDGALAVDCGGSDCDDEDPRRYPGNTEVCDVDHVDEDCDPSTYGYRDLDADGHVSSACCNGATCGTDCDDMRAGAHPGLPEVCDGFDNDCDGALDEGVQRNAYRDADGDGYGDPTMPVVADCAVTEGISDDGLDCDDSDPEVRPGAAERCNGRDDNCDGVYDVDADGDGHLTPRAVCLDDVMPRDDCNDFDPSVHPGALELCDLRDNDCDGSADEREDADLACRSTEVPGAFCAAGACAITACAPGRADCDGSAANGCETSTDGDAENCGGCGERCVLGTACVQGSCEPVRAVALDATSSHSCLVTDLGRVACFGNNAGGRLGDGTLIDRPHAVEVSGLTDAVDVSVHARGSCALRSDGAVSCWGGGVLRPAPLSGLPPSVSLDGASRLGWTCAVTGDAEAWCWGDSTLTGTSSGPPHAIGLTGVAEIATNMSHTCVRDASGGARCFGIADAGQLGDGLASHGQTCEYALAGEGGGLGTLYVGDCSVTPVTVVGLSGLEEITVGEDHSCARDARRVWCWGSRWGVGGGTSSSSPVQMLDVGSAHSLVSLDGGGLHTCALRADGQALCWGSNTFGQLGDGTQGTDRWPPVAVAGVSLVEVAAGFSHTCGIDAEGSVRCWGFGYGGQLGDRTSVLARPAPSRVAGLDPASAVAGSGPTACARTRSGRVLCWGERRASRFVPGLEGVTELAGRGSRLCALGRDGSVRCWSGSGAVETIALPPARSIALGTSHACAALLDGTVRCWGENGDGQLGDGTTEDATMPVVVDGVSDAVEVALGGAHSCARLGDGSVRCWGTNASGELGNGTGAPAAGAVLVSGVRDAVQIVAGAGHTCVRHIQGGVSCWGVDTASQLGNGPTISVGTSPQRVPGISGVAELAAGLEHTCAVLWSGEVWCWGSNSIGQSGQPTAPFGPPLHVATRVSGLVADRVGAGDSFTCAIDADGRVQCWGDNQQDQIGDGGSGDCLGVCHTTACAVDCNRETPRVVPGI